MLNYLRLRRGKWRKKWIDQLCHSIGEVDSVVFCGATQLFGEEMFARLPLTYGRKQVPQREAHHEAWQETEGHEGLRRLNAGLQNVSCSRHLFEADGLCFRGPQEQDSAGSD